MSQAEYFSRPFPFVAKLASLLRNNAAVQFVVTRFAGLLRSGKGSDEPVASPFLREIPDGKIPDVEDIPRPGERPGHGEAPGSGDLADLDATADPGAMPGAGNANLLPTAAMVPDEPAAAVRSGESEREQLIRRRWAETGIKMWSASAGGGGQAKLTIQGRADLLPAEPGATRREYDRLEFKLMSGQIVCEGVVVDPPTRRS